LLRPLADVRPGEAVTALLLTANVFLILTAYYLLKVAREPLILLGGGAEVKSYASLGQTLLLVGVSSAYGWLAARVSRLALVGGVTVFFVANLLVFWVLGSRGHAIGVPFYLWVGIFNVVTIAQFWSFAADTYSTDRGQRSARADRVGATARRRTDVINLRTARGAHAGWQRVRARGARPVPTHVRRARTRPQLRDEDG
jgi:ATP:ADP antiporter, AAA family